MLDKEKTVVVSFNGEIYNYKDLRKQLQTLGYQFFSNTDTETIIYAYKQWGIDFLHKLDGIFAISLFDLKKNKLYLVRDRIGVKPLYFSLQGGILSFASEIKALWQLPWMKKKLSLKAFYDYLTFMVTPAPYTIFDQVYKLPAGFYAVIDKKREVDFCQWYSPLTKISASEKREFESEDFCLQNIEHLLRQATKKRMMSDVSFGALLSGGVDSSLNVALMSEFVSKVKTFTVSFSDGPEFNELKWARQVAKKFGTDHHEIVISEKEAFDFYKKMIYHLDEPLADCVCIPFYYVSKLAKDCGVSVVQVGEGADELFFGYSTYASYKKFYENTWKKSDKIVPDFFKKIIYKLASGPFAKKTNHLEVLKNWAYGRQFFWGGAIAFNEHQKKFFLNKSFDGDILSGPDEIVKKILGKSIGQFDSYFWVDYYSSKLKKFDSNADFLKQINFLELKQRLPELLLMRADKMSMAEGVEARVPFLDHKLVEFMLHVPQDLKFKNNQTKYLLKKVASKFLPQEVVYRKKMGFAAPTVRWFEQGQHFPAHLNSLFNSSASKFDIFKFNLKNIDKKYKAHSSSFAVQKWALQNFFSQEW